MREFYAHRLLQRYSHDSSIVELPHSAGRLFQQYLVDAYSKVESQRLDWVVRNQSKLRVDSLAGLLDHLSSANDVSLLQADLHLTPCVSASAAVSSRDAVSPSSAEPPLTSAVSAPAAVGKPVILPATFGGSPRALHQSYLDSMCLVVRFGKPDFLITGCCTDRDVQAATSWSEQKHPKSFLDRDVRRVGI